MNNKNTNSDAMKNMNIDQNTMNNIKNMVDNGNISEAISQISPEMIQNFSKMFASQNSKNNNSTNTTNNSINNNNNINTNSNNINNGNANVNNYKDSSNTQNNNNNNNDNNSNANQSSNLGFDFSNIDMNTVMKMSSVLGNLNNTADDPRANLLNSLKPYLRDSKKGKLDNYMNLLNVSKIAEIMKNNKEK
jgi:hypothetical protein